MKPQTKSQKTVETNGVTNNVKFGIKGSGLHHILGILRDQLYSDKEAAVIREYACNAYDAHVEAGCADRPIEITLPTKLKLEFKVRDFGPALNDNEIQDVYAFYGESTKRNSNEMTGMLGIGSKSAFAYGDNFVINSYIDGVKHIHNAYIDPSQIGQISKLGEEQTSEENGIEIVVPVRDEDVDVFQEKAKRLLSFFKVTPIVHNASFEFDKFDTLIQGDGWRWETRNDSRYYSGEPTLVMGNIGYPLSGRKLKLHGENEVLTDLINENLVLEMEIGDVEISASRENLQYTEYTIKNIVERLHKVKDEMEQEVTNQFNVADTHFAAKQLFGSIFDTASHLYTLKNVLKDKLLWNGKVVSGNSINCTKGKHQDNGADNYSLHHFTKGYRATRYKCEEDGHIMCDKETVVIENDLGHRRGVMGRVLDLILNQGKKVYLISFANQKARKELFDRGLDQKLTKLSELPKRPLRDFGYGTSAPSSARGTGETKTYSSKEFVMDFDVIENMGYSDTKSSAWKKVDVDIENDSGIYVELDRFYIVNKNTFGRYSGENRPHTMKHLKDTFKKTFGMDLPKIHGFKSNSKSLDKAKESKNWTDLFDYLKNTLQDNIKNLNIEQKYADRTEVNLATSSVNWLQKFRPSDHVFTSQIVDGKFKRLFECHVEMNSHAQIIEDHKDFASSIGVEIDSTLKPTHDLQKMVKECNERYSMLYHLALDWKFEWDNVKGDLQQYINLVDICGNPND